MREGNSLNCPNCGSPIEGIRCAYCGTQFYDLADITFRDKGYLRIKIEDKIYIFKGYLSNIELTRNRFDSSIYFGNQIELNLSFQILEEPIVEKNDK